tara:strand:+ start:247 stop:1173 length:927 start_codon:yes stop_codon:yes gene_type:complete
MNKILITGGAGFIGSNLSNHLTQNSDNYIYCLDNLITGCKKNIDDLLNYDNFEFIEHDICESFDLSVNQIYNLACPASPIQYQKNPFETIDANIIGVKNILEIAKKYNATILQASTSEIYGDPLIHPQNETYYGNVNTFGIRSCYDEGKRMAETLLFNYHKHHKTDIRIARIFNTFGPNMQKNDGRVVSNFINQAINNENITIYGEGFQTRSLCYIDDMIVGLNSLMNSKYNRPINIGNDDEMQIIDLAKKILDITGSKSEIIHEKFPDDDPKQRRPDISKAKDILNFSPSHSISEGLKKTINYFKEL